MSKMCYILWCFLTIASIGTSVVVIACLLYDAVNILYYCVTLGLYDTLVYLGRQSVGGGGGWWTVATPVILR